MSFYGIDDALLFNQRRQWNTYTPNVVEAQSRFGRTASQRGELPLSAFVTGQEPGDVRCMNTTLYGTGKPHMLIDVRLAELLRGETDHSDIGCN